MCEKIKLENCKELIKLLITRDMPPEMAKKNYNDKVYERALREVLLSTNGY